MRAGFRVELVAESVAEAEGLVAGVAGAEGAEAEAEGVAAVAAVVAEAVAVAVAAAAEAVDAEGTEAETSGDVVETSGEMAEKWAETEGLAGVGESETWEREEIGEMGFLQEGREGLVWMVQLEVEKPGGIAPEAHREVSKIHDSEKYWVEADTEVERRSCKADLQAEKMHAPRGWGVKDCSSPKGE